MASSSVNIRPGEDAARAIEEAGKLTHEKMMDEAQQKETMPEDISELEKDLKVYLSEKSDSEQKRSIEDIFGDGQQK